MWYKCIKKHSHLYKEAYRRMFTAPQLIIEKNLEECKSLSKRSLLCLCYEMSRAFKKNGVDLKIGKGLG